MTGHQRSILAVAILTQGISVGLTMGILPVFLEPLEVAFDAPRTVIASGQILAMFALTCSSLVTGSFLDRGHVRSAMLVAAVLMSAAQLTAAFAPNLAGLALAALMAGAAVPGTGPITAASLISRTFADDRGRALGLMSMGPPLGSAALAALAGFLLLRFEWRQVFMVFSVVALVVQVPLILAVVPARFEPANDDGEGPEGMAGMVRSRTFLWAGGLFALAVGIVTGWTTHVAAYLAGSGFAEGWDARWLAVQFFMGIPGAALFGTLADRVALWKLFVGMLGTVSVCFVGLALEPGPTWVATCVVILGFTFGGMIPLYMMLISERLGADAMGRAMGLSNLLMLPVMAATVLFAARVFDATGGYVTALFVFAAGVLAALVCLFLSNRSARST